VKDALKKTHREMFKDLKVPSDEQFQALEDLVAALRPVEVLTSRLCRANFNVLQVFFLLKPERFDRIQIRSLELS